MVTWESDQSSMPKWNMDTESIMTEYENEQEEMIGTLGTMTLVGRRGGIGW